MNEEQEKLLKNAQYRKSLGIAYFNSTNSAIELAKLFFQMTGQKVSAEEIMKTVASFRDEFLEQHKDYYAKNIAIIGINYNPQDAIERLKSAKNIQELGIAWRSLSADERANVDIFNVAQELKKYYEETQ